MASVRRLRRWAPLSVLLCAVLLLAGVGFPRAKDASPFGAWRRVSDAPILSPQKSSWESAGTFNPAVIIHDGKFVMLYRAQDSAGTSRLGYAESVDGLKFTRRAEPVLSPEAAYELGGGVEDPRVQEIDGTYYLTYTGYNRKDAQLCLATSTDLVHWIRQGVIVPAYQGNWNVGWTKSGAIVPGNIGGKYWMYWLGTAWDKTDQMGLSYSTDLLHWTEATKTPVLGRRTGSFDSRVVEPGPPPVVVDRGIVLVYNGADERLVYRTGVAIFDAADPSKMIYRSERPIFAPVLEWEKTGQVPNVVFVEGMVALRHPKSSAGADGKFLMYYGAADKYVGVAEAELLE
jgi:beta-1,2-mannosidase